MVALNPVHKQFSGLRSRVVLVDQSNARPISCSPNKASVRLFGCRNSRRVTRFIGLLNDL